MFPFHTLDVFTDVAYTGNPLAVVLDAGALSTAQMQAIAREFNLSETIFVRPPADPAHTASVRIFLTNGEIPFAGHPTIGCAILLADIGHGPGDFTTLLTLEEVAGLVPVTVSRIDGRMTAEFTAPVIPHPYPGTTPTAAIAAAALGLSEGAIGFGPHTPGLFAGGPAFLFLPLATRADLARAAPRDPQWSAMLAAAGVHAAYLYTPGASTDFAARMFGAGMGVHEDPATGSATAILAAQLRAAGVLPPGTTRLTLEQGADMGRPSHLALTVEATATTLTTVRIAGAALRIAQGHITPPPQE